MVRISAKIGSVSAGEKMVIRYVIECAVIDNKVAFELISTFGVEERRSKIVHILTVVFLVFFLQISW